MRKHRWVGGAAPGGAGTGTWQHPEPRVRTRSHSRESAHLTRSALFPKARESDRKRNERGSRRHLRQETRALTAPELAALIPGPTWVLTLLHGESRTAARKARAPARFLT